MNAHQGNPFVDKESGEIGSVPNFDTTRLFNVFTYLQTALGSLLVSLVRRGERKVKISYYIKILISRLCMSMSVSGNFYVLLCTCSTYPSEIRQPLQMPRYVSKYIIGYVLSYFRTFHAYCGRFTALYRTFRT